MQYVYARTNPHWLLSVRNVETDPSNADYGTVRYLDRPQYYYFVPFNTDIDGDGEDDCLYGPTEVPQGEEPDCVYGEEPVQCEICESDLVTAPAGPFSGMVVDSTDPDDNDGLPNVHPDCVPHPDYLGPQGKYKDDTGWKEVPSVGPSDIHLIKRIVRYREDPVDNPGNFLEQVWLYRYNDFGFLKAVFDPTSVHAIIDADPNDAIEEPDDISSTQTRIRS